MRWTPLTFALLAAACGGTGPSDAPPPTGTFQLSYSWREPGVFGGLVERTGSMRIRVDTLTATRARGVGLDGDARPQEPFVLGSWNVSAYAVQLRTTGRGIAQFRITRGWDGCTGSMFYDFGDVWGFRSCEIRRL